MAPRYRNVAILAIVVVAQLILLGRQMRRDDGGTLLRGWTVAAVTPLNRVLHGVFDLVGDAWNEYVWLIDTRRDNERARREAAALRMENDRLKLDLARFGRLEKLVAYQREIPSKTMTAEVIGGGAGSGSRELLLNRGRRDGVKPGMAVIAAEGIVGKIESAYARSSFLRLINDPEAGVGVLLEESRARGVLKGRGDRECFVDHIASEVNVRIGETVYTSGADRVFPKGLPAGRVSRVETGSEGLGVFVTPAADLDRLDEVLIVEAAVHGEIPSRPRPQLPETLLAPPLETVRGGDSDAAPAEPVDESAPLTDADRLIRRYRALADGAASTAPEPAAPDAP